MLRRFYSPNLTQSSNLELSEREAHHAASVLRMRAGEEIEIFDGKGHHSSARLIHLTSKRAQVERGEVLTSRRYPLAIHLAQAVPHRNKLDVLIEKCEELAVSKAILVKSQHTVFNFKKDSFEKLLERLRLLVLEGAKQSRNNFLMEVEGWKSPEELAAAFSAYCRIFLMSPDAPFQKEPFEGLGVEALRKPVLVLIGPEGGFSSSEEAQFKEAGAWSLSLGDILLKCDTAALAAVSVLKYCFETQYGN
jgi:16S rRNA (uracil1498-N3)-methyltransferase